jgi:hypothetical protein
VRVIETKVLRRIFGLKRNEVVGWWRKLPSEEPRDSYSLPGLIRKIT